MWKIQEKDWANRDSEEPVNGDDDGYTTQDGSPSSDSSAPWFKKTQKTPVSPAFLFPARKPVAVKLPHGLG